MNNFSCKMKKKGKKRKRTSNSFLSCSQMTAASGSPSIASLSIRTFPKSKTPETKERTDSTVLAFIPIDSNPARTSKKSAASS